MFKLSCHKTERRYAFLTDYIWCHNWCLPLLDLNVVLQFTLSFHIIFTLYHHFKLWFHDGCRQVAGVDYISDACGLPRLFSPRVPSIRAIVQILLTLVSLMLFFPIHSLIFCHRSFYLVLNCIWLYYLSFNVSLIVTLICCHFRQC